MPALATYPRRFVPQVINLDDFAQLEPLFVELTNRPVNTVAELEKWLLDHSELGAVLAQEGAKRYIAMTCHTDDPATEKAYLHFVEEISPKCKPHWQKLDERYLAFPMRNQLDAKRYEVYDRNTKADVELYRQENIPLQVEEAKLDQQYQKISGAMMVQFDGKEQTLPQMSRYLEEPDRAKRQAAWEAITARRLQHRAEFDTILDGLIKLRGQMAHNAGYSNYVDYMFRGYRRFDYTPADCETFRRGVQEAVVPVVRKMQAKRKAKLGVDSLRPWDTAVDPLNRPPLRPFEKVDRMCDGVRKIISQIDPALAGDFDVMREANLLDLESRKGKAPGGYQYTLEEDRKPFIFMNAAGMHADVETLLHEAGHAFHALAARDEPLIAYRSAPIEFCEVASMSMELFGEKYMHEFYDQTGKARASRMLYEGILKLLPWVAQVDSFQRQFYAHPEWTHAQRDAAWLELDSQLGGNVDWTGYDDAHASGWHRQRHIFCSPLYYIEYGIAQLGALGLWNVNRTDPQKAVKAYKRALALGGSRPLPELFEAAGLKFDFGPATLSPLMKALDEELEKLPE